MAFDRKISLSVGETGGGLLISELEMSFDITRSTTFSENSGEFVIYNAKEQTRNEILKKGNNIIFQAGYADIELGTLFIGNIASSMSIKEDVDWVTTITASMVQSETKPLDNTKVLLSFNVNTRLSVVLQQIASATGLVLVGLENANITLPNGWTYVGGVRGALDYCNKILQSNSSSLYIDNKQIIVFKTGEEGSLFSAVLLDFDSGLKFVNDISENETEEKREQKKIEFGTIMIPKIQPNGLVRIDIPKISGVFTVEKAHYFGDNFGGDFDIECEAVA